MEVLGKVTVTEIVKAAVPVADPVNVIVIYTV
jgi:hypothetical protein